MTNFEEGFTSLINHIKLQAYFHFTLIIIRSNDIFLPWTHIKNMGKHRKIKICSHKRYTYILSAVKAFYNLSKVKWFPNSKVIELKISFMCERTIAQIFYCMLYFPTIHWNGFWGYFNYLSYKDVLYKKELSRLKMAFTLI